MKIRLIQLYWQLTTKRISTHRTKMSLRKLWRRYTSWKVIRYIAKQRLLQQNRISMEKMHTLANYTKSVNFQYHNNKKWGQHHGVATLYILTQDINLNHGFSKKLVFSPLLLIKQRNFYENVAWKHHFEIFSSFPGQLCTLKIHKDIQYETQAELLHYSDITVNCSSSYIKTQPHWYLTELQ